MATTALSVSKFKQGLVFFNLVADRDGNRDNCTGGHPFGDFRDDNF